MNLAGSWAALLRRWSQCLRNTRSWFSSGQRSRRLATTLVVERLEAKVLLAADTLGELRGTVIHDLTSNGQTPDDVVLNNVSVKLYKDGGNGQFDNGAGDDLLIAMALTDSNGQYAFTGLGEGTYFAEHPSPAGLIQHPGQNVVTVPISAVAAHGIPGTLIDDFSSPSPPPIFPQEATATPSAPTGLSSVLTASALGGERDLYAHLKTATGIVQISANAFGQHVLEFSSSPTGAGERAASWDGLDNDAATINPTGLGGIDLTDAGTQTGILLRMGADQSAGFMSITAYSDATHISAVSVPIPNTGGAATVDVFVPFDSFVTTGADPADFASLGAINFEVTGPTAVDGQLAFVQAFGPTIFTADFFDSTPLSLGNLVWNDLNNNGRFDSATEQGIDNVALSLFADTNGNGSLDVGTDTLIGTTSTSGGGLWRFDNLFPGDYLVCLDSSNFGTGKVLENFVTSSGNNPTPDPDDDVNNDDNGSLLTGKIVSKAVSLANDAEPINDGDTNANTNLSVDFGVFSPVDLRITKTDSPDPVNAAGLLTYTLTVTNAGPATATNVTVTDLVPSGVTFNSVIASQGTASQTAGTVTGLLGTLASGASATITLQVDVNAATVGTITNTASVIATEFDTNLANNSDTEPTTVTPVVDLRIIKTDSPDPVNAAGLLTYTLTVTNAGPSIATGVTVADVLPSGVTFRSASASQGSTSQATGTVNTLLGTLAPGASATITVLVDVNASTRGTITNTASVTSIEADTNLANNTASEPTTVVPVVDVSITKTDSPDPVNAAGLLTYTLTLTNSGPSTATGVSVTDVLPSGVTFRSVSTSQGTASQATGTVTASLGSLAAGASASITILVDVNASTSGTITNTASVTSTEIDLNLANNSASQPTTVIPVVDVSITKTDNPDPVNAAGLLTYTLTVTNTGPSTATNVSTTDILPSGVTFRSASASQGTASFDGSNVNALLGTLASGATATVTVLVDVNANTRGSITNTAFVRSTEIDTNPANNDVTEPTVVTPVVDVRIAKTDSPDPVNAAGLLTYTLTVTNAGPSTATGVTVADSLPSGVTFHSVTTSQGTTSHSGSNVGASLGTLASGATAIVTVIVDVNASTTGTIINNASVTSTEIDSNLANNSASEPTRVTPVVDVRITKTDNPDPVNAAGLLTYTLTVTNAGPSTATGVTVADLLPSGVTFNSVATSQGTTSHSGSNVGAALGTLASGASATITVVVDVNADTRGSITNTASVTSTEADTNLANNTASEPTTVVPIVDVRITKTDSPDPVNATGLLTYTLTVTNAGPSTATGVTVADVLPSGVTFNSVVGSQGSTSHTGRNVGAVLGTLVPGATATITILVDVNASTRGSITNTATVISNETDTNTANNSASAVTTVVPIVDVRITKTDAPDPVNAAGLLTYTLIATNAGPSTATGVTVSDVLPSGVTFRSATTSQGSTSQTAGTLTALLGTLIPGASATITILADVNASTTGTITNNAAVTSTETDTNLANNFASAVTTVIPVVDVRITKSDSPDPVNATGLLTYTLTVTNAGPSTATGVTVADVLPSGVTFNSVATSQGTTSHSGSDVGVLIGTLLSGATATITVTANVDATTTGTIINTASVISIETDINLSNNFASASTTVTPIIDLSITKSDAPDPVNAAGLLTYTLIATNSGPSTATGVTVTDILPSGVTFRSTTVSQGTSSQTSGTVTALLGTLLPGATATMTILVDVNGSTIGTITNNASIIAAQTETTLANNTASATTTITPIVDVRITKSDAPDPVIAGTQLTYTLIATNAGPSIATGVTISDVLPVGVTIRSVSTSQGNGSGTGSLVAASLGTLLVGASATVTIVVDVNSSTTGLITNTASVTSREIDSNFANNSASATTLVDPARSSVSGTIFVDVDDDGVQDFGEPPIAGTTVTLFGTTVSGTSIVFRTETDTNGDYAFVNLPPGTYTVFETQPTLFRDGQDAAGTGATSIAVNDAFLNIGLSGGGNAIHFNFGELTPDRSKRRFLASSILMQEQVISRPVTGTASLSGTVFQDVNKNNLRDNGDTPISGVMVSLVGIDQFNNTVLIIGVTDLQGRYSFHNLPVGQYHIVETQPLNFADGAEIAGTPVPAQVANDIFANISLGAGIQGSSFDFLERPL